MQNKSREYCNQNLRRMLDEADGIKEEYERLTHPPAEAQVDFGEVVQEGKVKDIHCLVMSFPYSNGGLVVPLPAENQECFLEGLKILFRQAGFVPRKLRLDNLSAAVRLPPQLDRESLESLYFVNKKENVILTGAPGTGKRISQQG